MTHCSSTASQSLTFAHRSCSCSLANSPRRTGFRVGSFPHGRVFLKYLTWNSGKSVSTKFTTMIHAKLQDFHMTTEANTADLAFFNPAVKTMLHRLGSAEDYTRTQGGSLKTQLGPRETAFIAEQDAFYGAAIGEDGWPYTQRHRGPKGFLRVLDASTLGFASMADRRRYISPGNALLFLIDHALQARLKIWADAEVSEEPAIIEKFAKI